MATRTIPKPTLSISSSSSGSSSSSVNWESHSKTIASGSIAVDGSGIYTLDPENGSSPDDLTTITGGSTGDEIILCTTISSTINIKHNIGNIQIGYDFQLNNTYDQLRLIKRLSGHWAGGGVNDNA